MKLIIAGSRDMYFDIGTIQDLIDSLVPMDIEISEIVSGTCRGIDISGENYAKFQEYPLMRFKPDWKKYKAAAGPKRNKEMAEYADALLLIWNGESSGSKSMKREMLKLNKPIYEVILQKIIQGG